MNKKSEKKQESENLTKGKKVIKDHEEVLYVSIGNIQIDVDEDEVSDVFEDFYDYMKLLHETEHFVWGGVLSPNQVMVIYEAASDDEAAKIAQTNPFIQKSHLIKFEEPKKWFVLFGMGVS